MPAIDELKSLFDSEYEIEKYIGTDTSFTKRFSTFYETCTLELLEKDFAYNCNGLMMKGGEIFTDIYGS